MAARSGTSESGRMERVDERTAKVDGSGFFEGGPCKFG